jgi:CHRD domain
VKKKMLTVAAALTLGASVLATARVSEAATTVAASTSYTIKATLNTKQEVPKPKDAVNAKGIFTGRLTLAGKKSRFTWTLRVSHPSGRIRMEEIGMGAPGKSGITMLPLCNKKCRLTPRGAYVGPYVDNKTFVKALLHHRMYVNVTTKLNPKGEIRGQIKATAA